MEKRDGGGVGGGWKLWTWAIRTCDSWATLPFLVLWYTILVFYGFIFYVKHIEFMCNEVCYIKKKIVHWHKFSSSSPAFAFLSGTGGRKKKTKHILQMAAVLFQRKFSALDAFIGLRRTCESSEIDLTMYGFNLLNYKMGI